MKLSQSRTPRLIQMEAVECGAAALGIILGYYRRFVSLEELRLTCGVSRDGVSAFQILQAARYYGLEGDAYYVEAADLGEMEVPAILYWEHNHFVVLEKIRGKMAWINDPATGPRTLPLEELQTRYSGVAILLKPSPQFVQGGRDISLLSQLKHRFSPFIGKFGVLILIEIVALFFTLCLPATSRIFIDEFLPTWLPTWQKSFIWFMVGLLIATSLITWIRGQCINRLQVGTTIQFNTQFVRHLLSLPISFFSQRFPGELLNRISLNTHVATVFSETIVSSVISFLLVVVYTVILFYYNQVIALVGICAALFNFVLLYWINTTRVHVYARLQQAEAATIGISYDTLENVETMKSICHDIFFFTRIAGQYTNSINASQSIGRQDAFLSTLSQFSVQLTNVVLLALGAWLVMQGQMTIGMLFAFQMLMNYFLSPFDRLVQFGANVQTLKVDIARVDDVLHHPIDPLIENEQGEEMPPLKLKGELTFQDVSFGYAPLEAPFISGLNLTIHKGERIGIVGPVGSGKSTLAKLGSALYQPWKGRVLFDGKTALEHSRETLKQSVSSVDQEIKLFAATLYDNIALWDPMVTETMVIEAAKQAQLHDEILRFPAGYHTLLLERGANISQGQKQRLELARALLYRPSLLILDETLNSVDSETEVEILKNIKNLGCSILLISHRLSTIRGCDRIVVMEQGQIVAIGTHEELLRLSEPYRRLTASELKQA